MARRGVAGVESEAMAIVVPLADTARRKRNSAPDRWARLSAEGKREETRGATGNWAACLLCRAEGKERADTAAGLQAREAGHGAGLG